MWKCPHFRLCSAQFRFWGFRFSAVKFRILGLFRFAIWLTDFCT